MASVAWSMTLTIQTKPGQMREPRSAQISCSQYCCSSQGVQPDYRFYDLHVYEDALRSENGTSTVDLLTGKVIKG